MKLNLEEITSKNRTSIAPNWHFVRLVNYNYQDLSELKQWLNDYTYDHYKTIGIGEHCPYEIGVLFESEIDAMAFKLVWFEAEEEDDDEDF